MIFKALFISLFCLSSLAQAFDKDFKIVSDRVPTEFTLLFNSLKVEIKTPKDKVIMVGLIQDMGENLSTLEKEHIFLLLKSEVIKNVLEHKFDKVREFDMTNLLIERLNGDFTQKEKYLSPFAQWIWRSILAELKYRQKMGLITAKSFNTRSFEGAKLAEAQRFQRYLGYILPWIDRMDSMNATQFNQLTKEVSWTILRRINERSILFKRFASTLKGESKVVLFNIPPRLLEIHPEDLKKMQNDTQEPTLKEKSLEAKDDAQTTVDKATPEDLSPISDDVIKSIDKTITPPVKEP
ncbi:MAG TPA: hypothetical protein VNJ08_02300 [Bacteriovoracaceae bacterium]|nr:hypothetical protein [Bacteriovoracaceae bacterium]